MQPRHKLGLSPKTLRETLENLGPIYVKIGQFLALRPDLVPQEYCDELLDLVDSAKFFPFEDALPILTEDLGPDPLGRFAEFDPVPVSAASLAQVYRARTHAGELVAVKLQRPGIHDQVRRDFDHARLVQPLIDLFRVIPAVSFRSVLEELQEWIAQELDFDRERRTMKRMRELLAGDRRVRIPRTYDHLSGPRVITMDYLSGIGFSRILRLARQGKTEELAALDVDRQILAENLLRSCLDQVFRHQFFHADIHPGNLFALSGNVVGFVDFGLTETIDAYLQPGVRRFVAAAYLGDVDGMLDALMQVLIQDENAEPAAFQADFRRQYQVWQRHSGEAHVGNSQLRQCMIGVMQAARPRGLRLPASLLSMYRSVLMAETVAGQLGGQADLVSVGRSFFVGLRLERLLDRFQPEQIERAFIPFLDFLEEPADKYLRFISEVAEGQYVLRVESSEAPSSRRAANHRAELISVAILMVAIAVLLAGSRGVLSAVLWVALGLAAAWLAILFRKLK